MSQLFSAQDTATIHEHYDEVLNYFNNRSTNAFAESFNAKMEQFRAMLRGISDVKFRVSRDFA